MKKKKWGDRYKENDEEKAESDKCFEKKKSLEELEPLITKWRGTFQEAATDLVEKLRTQMGGRGGGGGSVGEIVKELTLENMLLHFRIDPDLVRLNRDEDSF